MVGCACITLRQSLARRASHKNEPKHVNKMRYVQYNRIYDRGGVLQSVGNGDCNAIVRLLIYPQAHRDRIIVILLSYRRRSN